MAAVGKDLFPCPSKETLETIFVGKKLSDVPTPAAILDRAIVRRNCNQMLDACNTLQVGFRPHIKTTKVQGIVSLVLILIVVDSVHENGLVMSHIGSKPAAVLLS